MTKSSSPSPRTHAAAPTGKWLRAAACAAAVLLLTGHSAPAFAEPTTEAAAMDTTTVKIDNFTFGPKVLTVKAGTAVTWINQDDIPHTIIEKNRKVFRSKVLDTDDKFTFTFNEPGTYDYFCGLHPHMTAQIVVTP
jgi:plastocyanin